MYLGRCVNSKFENGKGDGTEGLAESARVCTEGGCHIEAARLSIAFGRSHLHMLRGQRLRAAVDEPRHVGWKIRHADTNVICNRALQPQGAVAVLQRNVGGQVNVFGTNEVWVLQLTHEQRLQGVCEQSKQRIEGHRRH